MPVTILAVDDEQTILSLISFNLEKEGYKVLLARNGEEALAKIKSVKVDLVLLDVMMPGMDGMEVCRRIKRDDKLRRVPVIFLTAKAEDSDVISGLELGAEDYVMKPFSPKVLVARIRNLLRKQEPVERENDNDSLLFQHGVELDVGRHLVRLNGQLVDLSATEFALLYFFMKNPGWAFSRAQIIASIRGDDYAVTERSVDVHILGLRRKLGNVGDYIRTVRGVGYRFEE